MGEFLMPSLGADMEAGTLVEWLVKPGDTVKRGDIIAVVETEKGAIEVEVFEAGVVEALLIESGARVPVGTVLATIRAEGAPLEGARAPAPPPRPLAPAPPRIRVSPLARRRAEELGVDLASVQGTGPGGAITREDVEGAAAIPRAAPPPVEEAAAPPAAPRPERPAADRYAAMRHAIAAAMARSKREIPHYYLQTFIDMERSLAWLEAENLRRPVSERILYAALLLKAVALAVREVPEVNGFWVDEKFQPAASVHVGVGISLRQGGLVAPAIHDTDKKSMVEVMRDLRDLVGRARSGSFRSSEVSDPTITVTNLGEQGVESVYGIIYPPQVALVGFGKIIERPWAIQGMLTVRPILTATLAADHRASDGHRGGLFLAAIDRLLQEPEKL
jgi:pyruvate dehydrogenase E2 component (dihydrolipoamide acetyltransferase)